MNIGVIDIGTRATRLLITNLDVVRQERFSFDHYRNFGELTEAGVGITPIAGTDRSEYRYTEFISTFRAIDKFRTECDRRGVEPENIYVVGTEVFRRVENRADLIDMIKQATGLGIKVLHPEEEAETTFWAAQVSCMSYYKAGQSFLVLEQGGGSLQIALASLQLDGTITKRGRISIPELGTVLLRRRFTDQLEGEASRRRVGSLHREVREFATGRICEALVQLGQPSADLPVAAAFGLGKAATDHYRGSNRKVHGKVISLAQMSAEAIGGNVVRDYSNYELRSLRKDIEDGHLPIGIEQLDRLLERLYGLPCYAAVLEDFGLRELQVCGTGLRYGVAFRVAAGQWKGVREYTGTA